MPKNQAPQQSRRPQRAPSNRIDRGAAAAKHNLRMHRTNYSMAGGTTTTTTEKT